MSRSYQKVGEYFEKFYLDSPKEKDLTRYFDEKGAILETSLHLFKDNFQDLLKFPRSKPEKQIDVANDYKPFTKTEDEPKTKYFFEDEEEQLIAVFSEMLQDHYSPPAENLIDLRIHLVALWEFYCFIRPQHVDFETILKFDIASLQIVALVYYTIGGIPSEIRKRHAAMESKRAKKEKQANETDGRIIEAYKFLAPIWGNGDEKKPITLDKKKITINKFSEEVLSSIKQKYKEAPSREWIIKRLKRLKNDRTI